MAVSFLDGKYVRQIDSSITGIKDGINAIRDVLSSSGDYGTDITENILLDRNIASQLQWQSNGSSYESNIFSIDSNAHYVMFAPKLEDPTGITISIYILDSDNTTRLFTTILNYADPEVNGKIVPITSTSLGPKMQISIASVNATVSDENVANNLFIAKTISNVALSELEKKYVRQKIGAGDDVVTDLTGAIRYDVDQTTGNDALSTADQERARTNLGLGNLSDLVEGVVKYSTDQSNDINANQKAVARANIGAVSSYDVTSAITTATSGLADRIGNVEGLPGAVRYDIDQTTGNDALTSVQQERARTNLGLGNLSDLVEGVVKYSEAQVIDPANQIIARTNIGAAAASSVSDLELALSGMTRNVTNVTKTNDGTGIIIEYADNTISDPITLTSGQTIDSLYYDEENKLHIYDINGNDIVEPIVIYGGGGGSGAIIGSGEITSTTASPFIVRYKQPAVIEYNFRAVDSGGESVGNGRGIWTVNGVTVVSNVVTRQGQNSFDISEYLNSGENTVRLAVYANIGGESDSVFRKTWIVNAVDMRFTWNYDDSKVNTDSFNDSCVVYGGNILKTIHTVIDDTIVLPIIQTTKSNSTQIITIPKLSHGAHGVTRWLTTIIGEEEQPTPDQYHEMVFVESGNMTPIIAVSAHNIEIQQYDTVQIPIFIYDPASLTTTADLYVDNVKVSTWANKDRTVDYWTYTSSAVGNGTVLETVTEVDEHNQEVTIPSKWQNTLKITCGSVTKEIPIIVNRLALDVSEVSGYDFKFKASDFITNDDVKNWSYTVPGTSHAVTASFSNNFDWVNGGIRTELVDEYLNETTNDGTIQQYFLVKAGTRMTLDYNLFAKDAKADGMTFKMVFKVKNCRKYNAEITNCYDEDSGIGIRLFANKAVFSTGGSTINIQYDEDNYTELEFDVYPNNANADAHYPRYIMGWLDGVVNICRTYSSYDVIKHNDNNLHKIIIGSDDCDVSIYLIKAYSYLIDGTSNFENHISNFIMDAPSGQEMLRRFNRNDILDDETGEISYSKLAEKNRDLRVWLYDVPYMTNDKGDKVNVSFQQIWTNGSNYYQMHGTGKMSVQGTSSVHYIRGAANTDIDFTTLYDGNNNDLLENGVVEKKVYGNNYFYKDSDNPTKVKKYSALDAKIISGVRRSYTIAQALSIAKVNDVASLGNEWVVYETDNNDVPVSYVNANDTDDPQTQIGNEWVVIERDSNNNPTKYIRALGMKLNDDSCPISYSNTKVNFASCEQVNNMCNAAWYQRFTPYPSLTKRDCMEFNIGVQFIKDAATGDSNHFALFDNTNRYNMYSIANMGNSKKNVHVFHDLSNPIEVCVEVKDSTEEQMRMVNKDMSLQDWTGDDTSKKCYYEMRYPDTSSPDEAVEGATAAWYELVSWMADSNPYAATNEPLNTPETYAPYTFSTTYHDRSGTPILGGRGGTEPLTISRYAGTYTTDSFERRMAKMLSECETHMVMDSFVYHYLYLTRHTMIDNVSKNNFWTSTDLQHWDLSKAYDMDTSDGNDNQGKLVFDYGIEFDDSRPDKQQLAFNGADSVWFRFIANLPEACEWMFKNRELAGAWSASEYHKFLTTEQHKVPERCWNQTYWYDYLRTFEDSSVDMGNENWMDFLDGGQKIHQRNHYEKYQELFLSSKYHGSASSVQNIRLYSYAPTVWGAIVINPGGAQLRKAASASSSFVTQIEQNAKINITGDRVLTNGTAWRPVTYGSYSGYVLESQIDSVYPKGELTITMYNKMYISIDNGTVSLPTIKVEGDTPYTYTFDLAVSANNVIMNINTASMITKLSGVEQLYCNNVSLGNAYRLREISIGTNEKGYYNTNLSYLEFGANRMLEKIYAQNLPNITTPFAVSSCPALEYVDTTGSTFTNYEFANGGKLETAILQSPVVLILKNLPYLTNLSILDYSRLIEFVYETDVEHYSNINEIDIIDQANALAYARLIGIDWDLSNETLLSRMYGMQGVDENNNLTSKSVLAGSAHTQVIRRRNLMNFRSAWPDLAIDETGTSIIEEVTVTFVDLNGNTLKDINGFDYVQYVVTGEDAYDPITAGEMNTPPQIENDQYIYTFTGWQYRVGDNYADGLPTNMSSDRTIYAKYDSEEQIYTVNWYLDSTEDTLLKTVSAAYGSEALYNEEDENDFPTKTGTESNGVFNIFKGWDKSTGFIRENLNVHAIWDRASYSDTRNRTLAQLSTPAEIYCAVSDPSHNISDKEYVDITVGKDFNFANVDSEVLLQNRYFNGTENIIRFNNIRLFDEDSPSFTLVIDYEFAATTQNAVLASCLKSNAGGFKLDYLNGSSRIVWGDQQINISGGTNRSIVAIRHRKGSRSIQVCSNNGGKTIYIGPSYSGDSEVDNGVARAIAYNQDLIDRERPRAQDTIIDSVLSFGGSAVGSGQENLAKGWIHFAKIWYDDLGNRVLKQLAYWPHETWRMEYCGSGRYSTSSGYETKATFISNSALPQLYNFYNPNNGDNNYVYTTGGWEYSDLRTFMNTRCFNSLPNGWISIIKKVQVKTRPGVDKYDVAEPIITDDCLYVPSIADAKDIQASTLTSEGKYSSEGRVIPWFTEQYYRCKFAGLTVPSNATYFTEAQSDPATLEETMHVKEGDVWITNGFAYFYISEDTRNKHLTIGGRDVENAANLDAVSADAHKGKWIRSYGYWLRTPYTDVQNNNPSSYKHFTVQANGAISSNLPLYSQSSYRAIVPQFSI